MATRSSCTHGKTQEDDLIVIIMYVWLARYNLRCKLCRRLSDFGGGQVPRSGEHCVDSRTVSTSIMRVHAKRRRCLLTGPANEGNL